jgi:adenine-specific DNA-methyltransferase
MRFIGNKENILENIYSVVFSTGIMKGSFCDFFSGTANVGRFFKEKGFKIMSSDLLYFSYVLQKAYIDNNTQPTFKKLFEKGIISDSISLLPNNLNSVIDYLNSLRGIQGFIYSNYTYEGTKTCLHHRMFFTPENGKCIDAIRTKIEEWRDKNLIDDNEYYVLLACLIETVPYYANISGVYAAYLKKYDPRAIKRIILRPIKIYESEKKHLVYNNNSIDLLEKINTDILYLDPPYNQRQYAPNYHLLETIAKYDNPTIKGVAGLRDYSKQKSDFCNKDKALSALEKIVRNARYKYLLLSYNSEGIMPQKSIKSILKKYGDVKLVEIDYRRYKSNNNGDSKHKKTIQEQVYLLKSRISNH